MKPMRRAHNTLTPMIGLSLAALVTGSLVALAVLAQRVSLDVPMADPVLPRPPHIAASAPPLVVENPPPASADDLDREPSRDLDVPPDRVLPLRISRPSVPGLNGPGGTDRQREPRSDKPPSERKVAHSLPPGIIKRVSRGGDLPPGHARRAAAGAKRFPHETSNGRGRGTCGEPPCGYAYGHTGGHSRPSPKAHGHGAPGNSGLGNGGPGNSGLGHGAPGNAGRGHGPPGNVGLGNGAPGNSGRGRGKH